MASRLDGVYTLLPLLEPAGDVLLNDGDVLIHAPGFEDRTLAICDVLTPRESATAILLDYQPFNSNNRLGEVRDGLAKIGLLTENQKLLTYNRFEPDDFEAKLEDRIKSQCTGRVVLDISTMSKLAIMLILLVLRKLAVPVSVLYSEAKFYGPNESEFNDARESKEVHRPSLQILSGIHGVVRVNSLASVAMQGQPTAALSFMSFNDALTQSLLNTVFPTRLFLINGKPPVHSWREEAMAWIHEHVRAEWGDDNPLQTGGSGLPVRSASTLDYRETVMLLLELYWELSMNHRILLAPAGSKLQAVGCCIVKALHPDIHIEYPSAEGFLKMYSKGIGRSWHVDLGDIDDLIGRVRTAEIREFLQIGESPIFHPSSGTIPEIT